MGLQQQLMTLLRLFLLIIIVQSSYLTLHRLRQPSQMRNQQMNLFRSLLQLHLRWNLHPLFMFKLYPLGALILFLQVFFLSIFKFLFLPIPLGNRGTTSSLRRCFSRKHRNSYCYSRPLILLLQVVSHLVIYPNRSQQHSSLAHWIRWGPNHTCHHYLLKLSEHSKSR